MNNNNTPLVINIDTGVISFRTNENAEQCNCRPISHKHAKMVEDGELEINALLAAIKKHMMSADDFDYDKYADERRRLNVRHSALHADDRKKVEDASADEYVTDEEIKDATEKHDDAVEAAVKETSTKRGRKPKAEDPSDGALAELGDIIK